MAPTGRLILPASKPFGVPLRPVTTLRILIIAAVLVGWEALAASGLLYRDVVPSLLAIGRRSLRPCGTRRSIFISAPRLTRSASPC